MSIQSISGTAFSSAAQEAKETVAQTKAEAAKGDQQAVQKLAKEQAQTAQSAPANGPKTGTSRYFNVKA